jgi:hypothetical protein
MVRSALVWLVVSAAAATPFLALLGILLLAFGAVLSLPLKLVGVPADIIPYAWGAIALITLSLALSLSAAGRHDAARRWGTVFVNTAGFMAAIATTVIVNGWSL